MDQALASSLAPSPTIVFRDGLGERRRVTDPTGSECVDLWYLAGELSTPAVEAGVRDRVNQKVEILRLEDPEKKEAIPVAGAEFIVEGGHGLRTGDALKIEEARHP